ncbi:hypothetical protein Tco_1253323 [Tanacetum coccineum]
MDVWILNISEEHKENRKERFKILTRMKNKIWYDEDVHDLRSVENEFPAIVFNDSLTSNETLSCEPTLSSLNDEIDFRISFDDSDDEDYTEQNVLYFNDLVPFNVMYLDDSKSDKDNDEDKIDIKQPSGVIIEYLVKVDLKARILELKRRYFEDYYSEDQYAVSIKEDTAYLCLHSPMTTKTTRSNTLYPGKAIRCIQAIWE